MKDFLVTVVLPIYNVEKYLDRCMESVTNQTYKNLEIIMVDDGATDSCPQKCDEWARKDERVKVIHKKNAGLGMARNTGIENATGDYIVFFDSDDYIELNTIERTVKSAKEYKSDIVTFGFSFVGNNGSVKKSVIPTGEFEEYRGEDIRLVFLPDLLAQGEQGKHIKNLWLSAWVNMYSMDLIRRANWRFVSERKIISEDVYSLLDLYSEVNSISIVSEALYMYCENDGSLTHTYREDRFDKICYFYKECYSLAVKKGYSQAVVDNISYPFIANTIGALKLIINAQLDIKEKYRLTYEIVNNEQLQLVINNIDYRMEGFNRKVFFHFVKKKKTVFVMALLAAKGCQ